MKDQVRIARVLIALVVSMSAGAFVLMALDNQSLSGGAFSLSSLYSLNPVEEHVTSGPVMIDWDGVEVYYSNPSIKSFDELVAGGDLQLHFAITNVDCGKEGIIKSTVKWRKQKACELDIQQGQRIIRICIIRDAVSSETTDCQVSRTRDLVETLSRMHNIPTSRIRYPVNWQI